MVPPKQNYTIELMTPDDGPRMIEFLKGTFFKDETLNAAVKLLGESGTDRCIELEEYCLESISEPLSLMAISNSGELIGVCLNGSHEPGHMDKSEARADECPNPKFRKILKLLLAAERDSDLFNKFQDVKKLLELRVLAVDQAWRGRGIATALVDKTREMAQQEGFHMVRMDCTNNFSARAADRLGFSSIYELQYSNYTEDGQPIFVTPSPHLSLITYVKKV